MPGGNLDTGNPMGKNSIIYGSYQGDDFTPGGGGARIPFMKHLPNALSYLKKGLRNVNDTMEHYNNLSGAFGSNSPMELDAMDRDRVFQNEVIKRRQKYIHDVIPEGWGGWNDKKRKQIVFRYEDKYVKRKDSLRSAKQDSIILIRKIDSILKKYDQKRDSLKTVYGVKD